MSSRKTVDVTCPCCETRIHADVLTGKVLRHAAPDQLDETGKPKLDMGRWDAANQTVSSRPQQAKDKFDDALGQEQSREKDLDDLFDRAQDKLKKRKEQRDDELL